METMKSLLSSDSLVREVSLGGRTIDGNVQFFYALIAMACLYGCFIGFGSAIGIQANITPLAARRCVTPTHKLKLILTDQLTSFALGYVDVIILILYLRYILNLDFQGQMGKMLVVSFFGSLIGVSMGMFIGSFGKMQEGVRIGLMLGISMVSSFLAGLMNGNMKDIVEKSVPFVNRVNPASLISDAFYCINVYDDMTRYYRNLITLAVMCVVLVMASFFMVRRNVMTVFKGYMRIMKKNTGLILLYLSIFFGVTMALQAAAGKETYTSYESEKIKIGVVDKDNGPLAEGLVKWLEGTHHVDHVEDDGRSCQEELSQKCRIHRGDS